MKVEKGRKGERKDLFFRWLHCSRLSKPDLNRYVVPGTNIERESSPLMTFGLGG